MNLTIIVSLILLTFVIPSETRAEYGVLLECQDNEHYVAMEQYTYYSIKITNTGDSNDTYNLTMDIPPEHWEANLSTSEISIPANEYRNVMLKVKTTCECEFGEILVINVTATSESDPGAKQTQITYSWIEVNLILTKS
jgi:uncharacterized membrane protein